jgi:hypothetical protein
MAEEEFVQIVKEEGAFSRLGHCIAAVTLGEIVGYVSEYLTDRIRAHRGELGAPQTGAGSGNSETLLDLSLDVLTQVVLLMLGIRLSTKAVDSISLDMSALIFFIMGISNQTTLPKNLRRLTSLIIKSPDAVVVASQ